MSDLLVGTYVRANMSEATCIIHLPKPVPSSDFLISLEVHNLSTHCLLEISVIFPF